MRLFGGLLLCLPMFVHAGQDALSFKTDVLPVLEQHCVDCHSGWFPKAGLRLDSLENLREGGPSGPTLIPGKPDKGWLPFVLRADKGRYRMPPQPAERVPAAQVQLILDWIAQGAAP